jgi:hypothetical protein
LRHSIAYSDRYSKRGGYFNTDDNYFHSINEWLVLLWHLWPRVGQIQGIGGLSRAAIQIA